MATSPKTRASFYAESGAEQSALERYQQQRKTLQDLLEQRENALFDPVLLAIAQGFLAPTKTGSFGESLSNVAAMVGPAQAAENKRGLEMAQIRAELAMQDFMAAQAAETGRQVAAQPSIMDIMRGEAGPLATQAAAQAPAARPAPQAPQAAPGAAQPLPVREQPPAMPSAPMQAAPAQAAAPNMAPPAERTPSQRVLAVIEQQLKSPRPEIQRMGENNLKLWEAQSKGIKVEGGNVLDLMNLDAQGRPKILYSLGKQEPFEVTYKGKGLTIDMTPLEYNEYTSLQAAGKEEDGFNKYIKGRRSSSEKLPAYGGEEGPFRIRVPDPSNPSRMIELTGNATARRRAELELLNDKAAETGNYAPLLDMYRRTTGTAAPQGARAPERPAEQVPARTPRTEAERARPAIPGQMDPELANLPLSKQIEITTDRFKASDKVAREQMDVILQAGNPQLIESSNNRLKEIIEITKRSPEAFGLLVQQGLIPALAKAAQEGLRVGPYTVAAPVDEFLKAAKLPPALQDDARRLTMLVDEEFFTTAPLVKGALGPSISNADAQFMKSPQARPQDSARIISYWAANRLLANRQLRDAFSAANQYPANMSPRGFIGQELPGIMQSYVPLFERLRQTFPASTGGRQ